MKATLDEEGTLYQDVAAANIAVKFGEPFVTISEVSGNQVIDKAVLAAFNKITKDVVWIRSERYWRPRQPHDVTGRQQPY
ncbi:hypothetical protein WKW80_09265 [Variovorax humicola]|uniref:Uncharacterized protein n=2 Tax=Variovorax humicola TaxID=1769758 RepID=A0ABU8VWZ2_9BURK